MNSPVDDYFMWGIEMNEVRDKEKSSTSKNPPAEVKHEPRPEHKDKGDALIADTLLPSDRTKPIRSPLVDRFLKEFGDV
jgi:hypothetical protein